MSNTQWYIGNEKGIEHILTRPVNAAAAPQAHEISVAIHCNSINFHDLGVVMGMLPVEGERVLLSDAAGVVTAVGSAVREFAVGDKVVSTFFPAWHSGKADFIGFGGVPGDGIDGYAQHQVTAHQQAFTHIPKHFNLQQAATIPTAGITAWRALVVEGGLQAGQTVLIQGTGGVSVYACQLAKAMGAKIIATSSSDDKLETMRELGADVLINYRKHPNWGEQVAELGGADVVVEVGGAQTLAQSLLAVKPAGVIALIGILSGMDSPLPIALMLAKQIAVKAVLTGSREQQQAFIADLERYQIQPIISKTFAIPDLQAAFAYQASQQHLGKIVLNHPVAAQ